MMDKLKLFELTWAALKTGTHNHDGNKFRV